MRAKVWELKTYNFNKWDGWARLKFSMKVFKRFWWWMSWARWLSFMCSTMGNLMFWLWWCFYRRCEWKFWRQGCVKLEVGLVASKGKIAAVKKGFLQQGEYFFAARRSSSLSRKLTRRVGECLVLVSWHLPLPSLLLRSWLLVYNGWRLSLISVKLKDVPETTRFQQVKWRAKIGFRWIKEVWRSKMLKIFPVGNPQNLPLMVKATTLFVFTFLFN